MAGAFRAVPRHAFVPLVPLEVAHADDVVLMKRDHAELRAVARATIELHAGLRQGG